MTQELPIERIMQNALLTCDLATPLSEVAARMAERRCSSIVVMERGVPVGIWTECDALAIDFSDLAAMRRPIAEVMRSPVSGVHRKTPVGEAPMSMEGGSRRHLLAGAERLYVEDLRRALEQRDQALALSRQNLQMAERVIDASQEGIIITNPNGVIEYVNPAFCQVTGYSEEEAVGRTPALLSSGRHDASFYRQMWRELDAHGYWRGEIWNRRKGGALYLERLTITAVTDDDGKVTHYAALFTDITLIRENEERVRRLAYYDPLTRLPNRRLLEDRLGLAIRHAHRQQQGLAVIFIDIDHFKQVNDTLGHAVGDELLVQVSVRLQERLREDDTLARLGGDEFLALLPELGGLEDVRMVARRLIDAIAQPFEVLGNTFRMGCSLGISLYPEDGTTADALVRNADTAMDRAKHEGRNTYRLFRTEMNAHDSRQLALESALRDTVESGEGLAVHYQPLVNRDSGEVEGAEALLRWHHPEFGDVSPGVFIPMAERSGLIIPLGRRVMEKVAEQLGEWRLAGLSPPRVAVNLSAGQFWQGGLVEQVRELFQQHDLPPGQIGFELTESVLLDRQQEAVGLLTDLRELGCRIAIDDFGTGYSSLSYLQDLPLTTLKVDRSFIQRLTGDEGERRGSAAIVAAVTGLAQELGLRVVAEGVETEEQLQALARYPVTLIQGYLTGRPVDAATFESRYLGCRVGA